MGETPKTSILFYSPSFPHYIAPLVNWQQRVRERHVREALKNYGEYLCTQLADQLSIHYELHKHPYKTFVLVRCAPRLAPGYPIWLSKLCPKAWLWSTGLQYPLQVFVAQFAWNPAGTEHRVTFNKLVECPSDLATTCIRKMRFNARPRRQGLGWHTTVQELVDFPMQSKQYPISLGVLPLAREGRQRHWLALPVPPECEESLLKLLQLKQ